MLYFVKKKGVILPLGGGGNIDSTYTYLCFVRRHAEKIWGIAVANGGVEDKISLSIGAETMRYTKKGVILPLGAGGETDDESTYTGCFFPFNGKIWCYYSGFDAFFYRTNLAISQDGMHFLKKGMVIANEAGEVNSSYTYMPKSFFPFNGKIYCAVTAYNGSAHRSTLYTSSDGMNFIKKGVIVPLSPGEIDSNYAYLPHIFSLNGKIYCIYTAYDGSDFYLALQVSSDGMRFAKKGIMLLSSAGSVDQDLIYVPQVFIKNNSICCFYAGNNGTSYGCLAITE